jgi:two-component system NtrC family sensor kinase
MLLQRILKYDGIPTGRIDEFRGYLRQVTDETGRVGRIVKDLLAFSRRSKPQTVDAELNGIVRATLSLVAHKLELAEISVDAQLSENLPTLRCDPSQIQQVVLNLVLNGAEAMAGGGTLTIVTAVASAGDAILLEIRDNGCGILAEQVDKIFEPFYTTKEDGHGVGLGLAVVYGIVQSHGGEIEVSSEIGKGTLFRVRLPVASEAPAASSRGPAGSGGA